MDPTLTLQLPHTHHKNQAPNLGGPSLCCCCPNPLELSTSTHQKLGFTSVFQIPAQIPPFQTCIPITISSHPLLYISFYPTVFLLLPVSLSVLKSANPMHFIMIRKILYITQTLLKAVGSSSKCVVSGWKMTAAVKMPPNLMIKGVLGTGNKNKRRAWTI